MATTVTNPDKFKFLDYIGLQELVNKIKGLIDASKNATSVEKVEYDAKTSKFTLTQGGTKIVSDAITVVDSTNSGLMTSDQLATLNDVKSNKIDKVALRIDGAQDATLFSSITNNDEKITVIDYIGNLDGTLTDVTEKQAPTAKAVKNALAKKVDSETYTNGINGITTRLTTAEGDIDNLEERAGNLETRATNLETRATNLETAIGKETESSTILGRLKTAEGNITELSSSLETNNSDISALKTFVGTIGETGTTSANVYNKSQVDSAIAAAKAAIVGGDDNAQLQETYKTLIAISDWIEANDSAEDAAGLTYDVANLKTTTANHASAIEELEKDVEAILGTGSSDGISLTSLNTRLTTAENDIDSLETGLTTAETDISNLKSELDTAETGIKARLTTAENNIKNLESETESLDTRLDALEDAKDTYATKTNAVGKLGAITLNSETKNYEMNVYNFSEEVLQTIVFYTITTDEINALFTTNA